MELQTTFLLISIIEFNAKSSTCGGILRVRDDVTLDENGYYYVDTFSDHEKLYFMTPYYTHV